MLDYRSQVPYDASVASTTSLGVNRVSELSRSEIREALIAAIADVEGVDDAAVELELAAVGGDALYELESKVAECVIAALGEGFGITLAGPADLRPDQYATIESLLDLLEAELSKLQEV
jgi:hypothetical protein